MNSDLFFTLAKPFVHHLNGAFLLILFLVLAYLFLCYFYQGKTKDKNILNLIIVWSAIILGLYFRLCLAGFTLGNYDMFSYEIVVKLMDQAKNVYLTTKRYNYSPIWFNILYLLYKFKSLFPLINFRFIIRAFLTLIDLSSLLVLYKISKLKKIFFPPVAVGFFLNPVSIILTGHHGQFENVTILLILSGIYFYLKAEKQKKKEIIKWPALLFLAAGIVKHIVINQVLVFYNFIFQKKPKVIVAFGLSMVIFLATFIPYWPVGKSGIIRNVFLYQSLSGLYGFTFLLKKINPALVAVYSKFFICLLFYFALRFKTKKLSRMVLINMLFFLTFTSGLSDQYLILPIALACLNKSFLFLVYTLIVSFYLFQSPVQLVLRQYDFVSSHLVWLVCVLWFIVEFLKAHESKS